MQHKKKELWRIVVFFLAILYILWMWMKKDLAQTIATLPKEQALPVLATTVAVSLLKAVALSGILLLLKWLLGKLRRE